MASVSVSSKARAVYSWYGEAFANATIEDIVAALNAMTAEGVPDTATVHFRSDGDDKYQIHASWHSSEPIQRELDAVK